jgi:peptidoglycan/LPS O-acetylase OafA/YrhL
VPAFVVVVAIYFCIPYFREKESLPPLWKFLTFTQNFGLNLKDYGTFSHAWSLCVEEHFYLGLPLILIVFQRMKRIHLASWLLIGLFILTLLARYYSYTNLYIPHIEEENGWLNWYMYIYYPTYTRLDGLLVGVSISAINRFLPTLWSRMSVFGNQFILLGLAVLVGAIFLCYDEQSFYASVFGFTVVAIGYGFLVIGAISPGSILFKLKLKGTAFIAKMSYAIYLTHKGIIHITHQVFKDHPINSNLLLVFSMIACIMAAYILHSVIELPFMRWRNQILSNKYSNIPLRS